MVRLMTREEILGTQLARDKVEVKEWGGGKVGIRELSGAEWDAWEALVVEDRSNARAKLLVRCIINDDGTRVFSDEDAEVLGAKSGNALKRIERSVRALSGGSEAAVEDAKGNSEPDPSDGSASA